MAKLQEPKKGAPCARPTRPRLRGPRSRGLKAVIGRAVVAYHDLEIGSIVPEGLLEIFEQRPEKVAAPIA